MNRQPDFSDRGQLPKRTNMWSSLGVFTGRVNFYFSLSIGETRQSVETGTKKVGHNGWLESGTELFAVYGNTGVQASLSNNLE